jgi:hypothetical protein
MRFSRTSLRAAIHDRNLSHNTHIPSRWRQSSPAATRHLRKAWLFQKSSSAAASARRRSLRFTRHRKATKDSTVARATTMALSRAFGSQSARTSSAASIWQEEVGRRVARERVQFPLTRQSSRAIPSPWRTATGSVPAVCALRRPDAEEAVRHLWARRGRTRPGDL